MRQGAFALVGAIAIACGGSERASQVGPSAPIAPTTAAVKGTVGYYDSPIRFGTHAPGPAPLTGATVTVVTAIGDGPTATTNGAGAHTLQARSARFACASLREGM